MEHFISRSPDGSFEVGSSCILGEKCIHAIDKINDGITIPGGKNSRKKRNRIDKILASSECWYIKKEQFPIIQTELMRKSHSVTWWGISVI